jgi:hypothetical protein
MDGMKPSPNEADQQAYEVPLVEQLRSIPKDYRTCRAIQWSDDGRETGHQFIPVGHMMHGAADMIEALQSAPANARAVAEKCAELCRDPKDYAGGPSSTRIFAWKECEDRILAFRATLPEALRPATARSEPVAWLHKDQPWVITDRVRQIWLASKPSQVENYTIPLYAAPLSETPAGGTAKVPERETRRVYKADAEEYRSYITARFEKPNSGYRFRWLDREWRYEHSDFDERGDFDLLLAAAPSPDGNEESK